MDWEFNIQKLRQLYQQSNQGASEDSTLVPSPSKRDCSHMTPLRVLSLDGGGIRGLMTLMILQKIEEKTGRSTDQLFHFIGGTSTGGMIALATGLCGSQSSRKDPVKIEDLIALYKNMGEKVFLNKRSQRWGYKYDPDGLEKELKKLCGEERKLLQQETPESSLPRVITVAVEQTHGRAFLFRSWKVNGERETDTKGTSEGYMWEAGRASSAAPFYFPAFKPEHCSACLDDGGIKANCPIKYIMREGKIILLVGLLLMAYKSTAV